MPCLLVQADAVSHISFLTTWLESGWACGHSKLKVKSKSRSTQGHCQGHMNVSVKACPVMLEVCEMINKEFTIDVAAGRDWTMLLSCPA